MARLYVGCSLTQAPVEFVAEVERLKALLRKDGHKVSDFLGLVKGTPVDVYEQDIHQCVADCELMLAICDYPSIGLGWEMGTMVEKRRKPVLAVAKYGAKVSRLPIGADCDRNPLYRFARYEKLEEVLSLLTLFQKSLRVLSRY